MNEGKKTLTFWAAASAMLGIAAWVAWPTEQRESNPVAGNLLFEKFTDPLSAASMKIVTFDEERGQLKTFEVRRDRESGLWNIPSRDGYPADAIEHIRTAANALIGLKILDVQTSNAENHDDLGVSEPKLEDLEIGDDGVGRLVIFKNESQDTLGSIIIGDQEQSDPEKRYVRIPGQDPVYVVKLDQSPLTTKFEDWIESDLLKLSSIDIGEIEIQDYTASAAGGRLSLTRNYLATVKLEGTQWELGQLSEYAADDPLAEPTVVEVPDDEKLNKSKLDAMKNALDDLKIVDVIRKPDGMSENLRASKDFLGDREALASLQRNGFIPASTTADGDVEILSANGELSVTLKDGVKYVMRFGNVAGVSEAEEDEDPKTEADDAEKTKVAGVNRYLLVTTMVDESKFPVPELKAVPKTIEELKTLLNPPKEELAKEEEAEEDSTSETESAETESAAEEEEPEAKEGEEKSEESETTDESGEEGAGEEGTGDEETADEDSDSEELDESQEGEDEEKADDPEVENPSDETDEESADEVSADETSDDETSVDEELSEEEWQERLEAEQEKVTKENQRKLDERKDKREAATKKVRELNARFADWYYVIAEETYTNLRIKREDLLEKEDDTEAAAPPGLSPAGPQFQFPGAPGN